MIINKAHKIISGLTVFFLATLLYSYPEAAFAATTGPNSPASSASANNICGSDNSNYVISATNLQSNDTTYASITSNRFDDTDDSDQLDALNFGFSGITGTIDGIQVDIYGFIDLNGPAYFDDVHLTIDGGATFVGVDQADGTTAISSTDDDSYDTFGGSSDDWSASLTPGDINSNTNFGVSFCMLSGAANTEISIDHVRVTITYTAAADSPTVTTTGESGTTVSTVVLNGNITATSPNSTVRGFAYGTASDLSTTIATTSESGSFGTGTFNELIETLQAGITYYYRAYATNPNGTGYGIIDSFIMGTDTTPSRKMRLFEGFTIKLIGNTIVLYGQ